MVTAKREKGISMTMRRIDKILNTHFVPMMICSTVSLLTLSVLFLIKIL